MAERDADNKELSSVMDLIYMMIGVMILTAALILSALMGIFQEKLYTKHGKYPREAMFYCVCQAQVDGYYVMWYHWCVEDGGVGGGVKDGV